MTLEDAIKDIIESGINLGAGDYVDLEALKTVVDADIIMNWIPCSERLPEEDGYYTTTRMTESGLRYVAYGSAFSDGRFHSDRVIAWLPYFKPYEGNNVSADLMEHNESGELKDVIYHNVETGKSAIIGRYCPKCKVLYKYGKYCSRCRQKNESED